MIVCVSLALAVALFSGVFAVMGWGSLLGTVGSTILYPFQWTASKIGGAVSGFVSHWQDMDALQAEVESLREENESLKSEIIDAEIKADENHWLYQYLLMKEDNSDYSFSAASVVSTTSAGGEAGNYITEMTLNKGSTAGVEAGMPVVTIGGLVGVVVDVQLTHCRVSTVLDPSVSVGAITTRGSESGLCEGDHSLIHRGRSMLRYLPEGADVEEGDILVTSGRGSVYPYGIPIGRLCNISVNAYSRTTEAEVETFVDFTSVTQVMILTSHDHEKYPEADTGGGS